MSDSKSKYVVDSEWWPVGPSELRSGFRPEYVIIVLPGAEFPTFEQALDEAARRIKAGHEVRITRPDGGYIHHEDVVRELRIRTPRR